MTAPTDVVAPTIPPDGLEAALADLEWRLRWYRSWLEILMRSWKRQELRFGGCRDVSPETERAIAGVLDDLETWLADLRAGVPAEPPRPLPPDVAEDVEEWLSLVRANTWHGVTELRARAGRIEEELSWIGGELNQRTEGFQIVSVSDPNVRASAQAGAYDLAVRAAERLFCHFVSRPAAPRLAAARGFGRWGGIALAYTGGEYLVQTRLRLLRLPADFKLNVHSMLLPLAHEAAHQILAALDAERSRTSEAGRSLQDDFWALWMCVAEAAREEARADERRNGRVGRPPDEVFRALTRDDPRPTAVTHFRVPLVGLEVLCDVIAGLLAGPAFFRCLASRLFVPYWPMAGSQRTGGNLPPAARLMLGCAMARALEWDAEAPDPDPWRVCRLQRSELAGHDLWGFWERRLAEGIDLVPAPAEPDPQAQSLDERPDWYVLLALWRQPRLLVDLARWFAANWQDGCFYPFAEDAAARATGVVRINEYCRLLADRMMYDDELILDAPLRYIAAAAELPEPSGPLASSGRLVLSLFYSADRWPWFARPGATVDARQSL